MDEERIQSSMERLYAKQRRCLIIQKALIVLSVVFYRYGIILLPLHLAIVIFFGGILSNKATSLSREKYPYVPLRTSRIGKGYGWDPHIIEEARQINDELTVRILSFNRRTVYFFLAAMLSNALIWILAAIVK